MRLNSGLVTNRRIQQVEPKTHEARRVLWPLMIRVIALLPIVAMVALAADDTVTFKSDVKMTRLDAQVVDATGRPITGLEAKDFVLRVDGKVTPIRNFGSESMPVDVLLLLDVSGSMEPHVQRIADASDSALRVLAPGDRVAIMVFDTHTRVRMPFKSDHGEISQQLHSLIRSESFNGGTHITRAMIDAANYVQSHARPNARRAIVILTDDETQDAEDEPKVEQALDEANAVLSFLHAPYAEDYVNGQNYPRSPRSRGTWGGSGPVGGGSGPVGGGSGPIGSTPWPGSTTWPGGPTVSPVPGGPGISIDPSHSAGTADIAKDSGGDVMDVDDASAFEDTLARLRQRYALYFYWPPGPDPEQRIVTVALSRSAGEDFRNAEVRYRRAYIDRAHGRSSGTLMEVSRDPDATDPQGKSRRGGTYVQPEYQGRRPAVNDESDAGPNLVPDDESSDGATAAPAAPPPPSAVKASSPPPAQPKGWPDVDNSGNPQ